MWLFIFIKFLFFWAGITLFAWQTLRLIFKTESREVLLALSLTAGPVFYIFILNILGHFFPITFLFFYIFIALTVIGLILLIFVPQAKKHADWLLTKQWRQILFITLAIIFITTGLIATRGIAGDEINIFSTVPMAGTIAEGNFPVRWTVEPQVMAYYHYGIELFSAALYKITALPLGTGVDFCRAYFTTLFLFLIFLILINAVKRPAKAFFVALLTLFGGGLVFLYGFNVFQILYQKLILHQFVAAPWKFLHQATTSGVAGPLIKDIHIQWGAISFLLIIAGVFLYFRSVAYWQEKKNWWPVVLVNIIFLSVLALVGETFLLIELGIIIIYPFLTLLIKSQKPYFKKYLLVSLLTVIPVALIAAFQGGVLTELFRQSYDRHPKISGNWFYFSYEKVGYLWSAKSLINFGLPLFLILPCLYWLYFRFKKAEYYQEILTILLLSLACFAVPFVIELGPRYDYEMARYLYLAPPFWSMAVGLVLAEILFDSHKIKKVWRRLAWSLAGVIILGGVLFQIIFIVVPLGRSGDRFTPFFFHYPPPTPIEQRVYTWMKKNTSVNDYFWSYSATDVYNVYNKKMNIFAGRIAPVYSYMADHRMLNRDQLVQNLVATFARSEQDCQPDDLRFMGYKYLYVNEFWPSDLEQRCLAHKNLELLYQDAEGASFARIYKINY